MQGINIFSVRISTARKETLLAYLSKRLSAGKKTVVFTPNTQMLLTAKKEPRLRRILASSTVNIPDGVGVCIAAKIRSRISLVRLSGIDLATEILKICAKRGYRVFLLGAKSGVAALAAQRLQHHLPDLKICGTHHGYFKKQGSDNDRLIEKINRSRPDVLFVCFGFPTQEEWISKNAERLATIKLAIGLGGALDVWSGRSRRAPVFFQKAGLEWLWRVALEPHRAKIFLDIPIFLLAACKKE